ncbi:hypothetical protein [Sediminibacillus massiliensis]|uniref:hypothetical protein n=1 Tax=Sediminibacillus massiliensis TaxID=1926277 RepID=UPI00098888DC|nr:hypothetical protein [Sediminibacillus massiliensis]
MEISVNEQTQKFYLALDEWLPVTGHEIKVGKYHFCAIPLNSGINVSEATSGARVMTIPMNLEVMTATESKEDTMKFLYKVGEFINRVISKRNNFEKELQDMRKQAFEKLGEMPPIEDVITDWIFEDESDFIN